MSEIADANSLRGAKFKELMGKPKTWVFLALGSLAMAGLGAIGGAILALIFYVVAFLLGIGIVFWIADHRAAQAFYEAYAKARGLIKRQSKSLDGSTPLLRKGDKQRVDVLFEGELVPGVEGQLALWTYIVETRDSKGNKQEVDCPFTLILVSLPETLPVIRDLRVQRKAGLKALEKFEDAFRRSHERVTLESEALRDRYEIFRGKDEDEVWIRRLFSPGFIVWMSETPPEKFAFELENGWLCAYVPKHRDSVDGLDEMTAVGTAVAARIREEAAQTSPATERESTA
ncbi:MAG: hypothetical protein J0H66_02690 [Solirubrobacterales bacterium]|nr:hypothetical protein [Solirubrobacterales bacterium]OJU95257.1 MAG: hypothetical protein BGO23_05190 [Solirubrobacterales bacterium 67-14]